MPNLNSTIIGTRTFTHKNLDYVVAVFTDINTPFMYYVDVSHNGKPAIITYPDGHQASLTYSVSFSTRADIANLMGINALTNLVDTAEADIRRFN